MKGGKKNEIRKKIPFFQRRYKRTFKSQLQRRTGADVANRTPPLYGGRGGKESGSERRPRPSHGEWRRLGLLQNQGVGFRHRIHDRRGAHVRVGGCPRCLTDGHIRRRIHLLRRTPERESACRINTPAVRY